MRRIENDATNYKRMLQRQKQPNKQGVDLRKQKPQILAGGDSSITQIKSKEAKGDYKAWRKKAIAEALSKKPRFIKYKENKRQSK